MSKQKSGCLPTCTEILQRKNCFIEQRNNFSVIMCNFPRLLGTGYNEVKSAVPKT